MRHACCDVVNDHRNQYAGVPDTCFPVQHSGVDADAFAPVLHGAIVNRLTMARQTSPPDLSVRHPVGVVVGARNRLREHGFTHVDLTPLDSDEGQLLAGRFAFSEVAIEIAFGCPQRSGLSRFCRKGWELPSAASSPGVSSAFTLRGW
jgi:hypothetical protein